jgi:hypothetical protein
MKQTMQRVADWHGEQAAKSYARDDLESYARNALIADFLWSKYK